MRCPECRQNNVPGSLFCEHCGADLSSVMEDDQATAPVVEPTEPCPECGHGNRADYVVCESCGHRLAPELGPEPEPEPEPVIETAPEPAPEPEPVAPATVAVAEAAEVPQRRIETGAPEPLPEPDAMAGRTQGQLATGPRVGKVKLVTEQGMVIGKQYLLNGEEMMVGREDPSAHFYPDLDLTGLDEGYVHRKHARLTFEGSFLFVTHLGGHNRTYVNNRPIADNLAHPLNIGDTVQFGKVVMRLVEA
jgi:hypothetical protein